MLKKSSHIDIILQCRRWYLIHGIFMDYFQRQSDTRESESEVRQMTYLGILMDNGRGVAVQNRIEKIYSALTQGLPIKRKRNGDSIHDAKKQMSCH